MSRECPGRTDHPRVPPHLQRLLADNALHDELLVVVLGLAVRGAAAGANGEIDFLVRAASIVALGFDSHRNGAGEGWLAGGRIGGKVDLGDVLR